MRSAFSLFAPIAISRLFVTSLALLSMLVTPAFAQESEKEKEKDDPRARQQYIEELRGADSSIIPPGARLKALREMDEMIREEGRRYWRQRDEVLGIEQSSQSSTSSAASPNVEPSITNGSPSSGQWLFIGPRPTLAGVTSSGRTTAIVTDPNDVTGNTVYIGGAQGGVWKTTDGGANWTPLTDSQASLAIGALAIDGSTNPSTVYAGTGELSNSGDSYYGAGVLKSTDGGTTWTQLGAATFAGPIASCSTSGLACGGAYFGGISVRPGGGSPATLIAGVNMLFSKSGIYRSTDGGVNWTLVSAAPTTMGATAVQYATNMIAYAGVDSVGVMKSLDGGATWAAANGTGANVVATPTGRVELAVALSDTTGNTVYASVGQASNGNGLLGLYKTIDGGANWTQLAPSAALPDYCNSQCWYDNTVAVSPVNPNVVFVGGSGFPNQNFLYKSVDGGTSWTLATGSIHADQHSASFTGNGSKLYWGNDGGVYSTTSLSAGAVTWTNLNNNLGLTQFYTNFALHPTDINQTIAGSQDNGTQRYDGTQDISLAWSNVTCGDGAGAVIDAFSPSVVYSNCQRVDIRKSTSGGVSGFVDQNTTSIEVDTSRVAFIPPMIGDNNINAANNIYFGTQRVWQSKNGAASWQPISLDLTNGSSNISNMLIAPSDPNIMYVVTRDGKVAKGTGLATTDCTNPAVVNCFADVTGAVDSSTGAAAGTGLIANRRLNAVAISASNPDIVYVAHTGFSSASSRHVFKSTTGGGTWTNISGNLPNTPVNDLVADPDTAGTLYAGTDVGVFKSTDDGANWSTLANGLPRVAIFGLKLHRSSRVLRAATHGRGFWDLAVPLNITGPGGILSPSSISFTSRALNSTSVAQSLSFNNNGTAATTIGSVSITAGGSDFAISSNGCSGAIAAGGSCNISITFTPTTAGTRTGTLTVASNASGSPATASLNGVGAPANDNFANAIVVTSGSFTHSVSTVGATTEGSDPISSCDLSSPTRSKSVWYFYTPGSNGQASINTTGSNFDTVLSVWTGTIGSFSPVLNGCNDDPPGQSGAPSQVTVDVVGGTTYRVFVSGFVPDDGGNLVFNVSGPAPAVLASLTISPNPVTFNTQTVSTTSSPIPVTLTAAGGTVTGISVGTASGDFAQTNNCSSLTVGTSCTVNVTFTPTAVGTRNGSFVVTSSGTGSPQTVNVSGVGVDPLSLSPSTVVMTAVVERSTPPQAVTFSNTSGGSVTVTNVAVTGDYSQTHDCGVVANGNSCTINVTFSPLGSGARNGTLTVTTTGGTRNASLTGTGVGLVFTLARTNKPSRHGGGSVSVLQGQSATIDLELGISSGVDETVTFECTGAPRGSTCSVTPSQARLDQPLRKVQVTFSAGVSTGASRLNRGASVVSPGEYSLKVMARLGNVVRTVIVPVTIPGNVQPRKSSTPTTRSNKRLNQQ